MNQLLQEMIQLKQDTAFVRNLTVTTLVAIACSLSLAEIKQHPTRLARQEKLSQFSHTVSAGMVIRTYEAFYR
ncbi:MAG: hypothetical protein Tsb0014_40680 [Pleurocapsa sp.]